MILRKLSTLLKKTISLILVASLINLSFSGCSKKKSKSPVSDDSTPALVPDAQGNVSGKTEIDGTLTIESKEFDKDIKLSVKDDSGKKLPNIDVDYKEYGSKMSFVVTDPSGKYADAILYGSPSDLSYYINSNKNVIYKIAYVEETEAFITVAIVLTLFSVIWGTIEVLKGVTALSEISVEADKIEVDGKESMCLNAEELAELLKAEFKIISGRTGIVVSIATLGLASPTQLFTQSASHLAQEAGAHTASILAGFLLDWYTEVKASQIDENTIFTVTKLDFKEKFINLTRNPFSIGYNIEVSGACADRKYTLQGKILENNTGLSGVSVRITGSDVDKTVTTDSNGNYNLICLLAGTYTITPSKSGYTFNPSDTSVTISGDDFTVQDITATKTSTTEPHEYKDITFVSIPGGTFQMGDIQGGGNSDERPVHDVTLSGFEMSVYEITNAQYAAYLTEALSSGDITASSSTVKGKTGDYSGEEYLDLDDGDCEINYSGGTFTVDSGKENHPAIEVSWHGAKAFALYYGLDLPREAEWEYTCRAGTETKFYTGNNLSSNGRTSTDLDRAGWYYGNANDWTHPVGRKEPNAWGLHDMHGNVWEWCSDWYGSGYYSSSPLNNPTGSTSGSYRVLRGGGWGSSAGHCRSAYRYGYDPSFTDCYCGFRVVRRP